MVAASAGGTKCTRIIEAQAGRRGPVGRQTNAVDGTSPPQQLTRRPAEQRRCAAASLRRRQMPYGQALPTAVDADVLHVPSNSFKADQGPNGGEVADAKRAFGLCGAWGGCSCTPSTPPGGICCGPGQQLFDR
jgi:hypothetical protein